MNQIPNSFRPPELPGSLRLGDEIVHQYAISHAVNIRVHNGKVFFNAHAEVLSKFSSVYEDIFDGDSECREISMNDISDKGLITLERILYYDHERLMDEAKPSEEVAEAIFLFITKYGFKEKDLQFIFACFVDINSVEEINYWVCRLVNLPLSGCINELIEWHFDERGDDDVLAKLPKYDNTFIEMYCDQLIQRRNHVGPVRALFFARAWSETQEGEYLLQVVNEISRMKVMLRKYMNTALRNASNEDEYNNLVTYEAELESALTWAEGYVETGVGKCGLEKDRIEEMANLMESDDIHYTWHVTSVVNFLSNLQSSRAT